MAEPTRRRLMEAYLDSLEAKKKLSDPIIPEDTPPGIAKFPPADPNDPMWGKPLNGPITNPPTVPRKPGLPDVAPLDIFW